MVMRARLTSDRRVLGKRNDAANLCDPAAAAGVTSTGFFSDSSSAPLGLGDRGGRVSHSRAQWEACSWELANDHAREPSVVLQAPAGKKFWSPQEQKKVGGGGSKTSWLAEVMLQSAFKSFFFLLRMARKVLVRMIVCVPSCFMT